MSSLQRRVGMLILIALVISPIMLFAQEDSPLTIAGSGIPAPLVQEFATAANVAVNASVTGTNAGFNALCAGEADVAIAARAITADEEAACADNGIEFVETLLAYDIMTVIVNAGSSVGQCLSADELDALFAPSSTVTNWNQVAVENPDLPLSLYVLADNTTTFALLDSVVEGVGLRDDVTTLDDSTAVVEAVSTNEGAVGVTTLTAARAAGDAVTVLDLSTTSAGCAEASAEGASGRTYEGAYTLYLYANAASLDAVTPLLNAAFADDAAAAVESLGFVSPTETELAANRQTIADGTTGRQFSRTVTDFAIPQNLVGVIAIAGSATGADYIEAVTGAFVQQYPSVTLSQQITGEAAGIRSLCNGEVDMVASFQDLPAEEQANCDANNIVTETIDLGSQAVVVLGNGDFLTCMTTEQLATVWGAVSETPVNNWSQVSTDFPDLPITLVAPPLGDRYADILMLGSTDMSEPIRADVAENKSDPAYRATAVSNVEGGMTYLSWQDFRNLTDTAQGIAEPVAIDAGSGCVSPSAETIGDGSYVLARPLKLIINQRSLSREDIQSLLWFFATDANYSLLQTYGFSGLEFSELPDLRDTLQALYEEAEDVAAQQPEATLEPAAESTGESTSEPTAEATAENTQDS